MNTFITELEEHSAMTRRLADCSEVIESAGDLLIKTLRQGGKILLCGNGGSAADSQHIAAELVVRYQKRRQALAGIALTTDTSILTAHTNDYEFDSVFSRQVEALANPGDCLIAISTSGQSKNILKAVQAATNKDLNSIAMTGSNPGAIGELATISVAVPSTVTARVQEAHILIAHWWCLAIEENC